MSSKFLVASFFFFRCLCFAKVFLRLLITVPFSHYLLNRSRRSNKFLSLKTFKKSQQWTDLISYVLPSRAFCLKCVYICVYFIIYISIFFSFFAIAMLTLVGTFIDARWRQNPQPRPPCVRCATSLPVRVALSREARCRSLVLPSFHTHRSSERTWRRLWSHTAEG